MTSVYYCVTVWTAWPHCIDCALLLLLMLLFLYQVFSLLVSLCFGGIRSTLSHLFLCTSSLLSHLVTLMSLTCVRLSPQCCMYSDCHLLPLCAKVFIPRLYTFGSVVLD